MEYRSPDLNISCTTIFNGDFDEDQAEDFATSKDSSSCFEDTADFSFINDFQQLTLSDKESQFKSYTVIPKADSPIASNYFVSQKSPRPQLEEQKEFNRHLLEEKVLLIAKRKQELEALKSKLSLTSGQKKPKRKALRVQEEKISTYLFELEKVKAKFNKMHVKKMNLIKETHEVQNDLSNVQNAYNGLLGKYERCKQAALSYDLKQKLLVERDTNMMLMIQQRDQKIELIKAPLDEKLQGTLEEYQKLLNHQRLDNEKLRVRLKKMEIMDDTFQKDLEQKSLESGKLHKLCDDFITGRIAK